MPPAGPFINLRGETNREGASAPYNSLEFNTLTIQYTPHLRGVKVF